MTDRPALSPPRGVAVVGDILVDVVVGEDGTSTRTPGGAGLNVAIGVQRLGVPSFLAAPVASDDAGRWLQGVAAQEGVGLIPLASAGGTGVATSVRHDGEPRYEFSDSIHQRRYTFTDQDVEALKVAEVLALTSFPMDDRAQVDEVLDLVRRTGRPFLVDPNVRPTLTPDPERYLAGLRRLAGVADVVKVSTQDAAHLGAGTADEFVRNLLACGAGAVVLTMAEQGARVRTRGGVAVDVPVPIRTEHVVDTMGAGDAVLAELACGMSENGTDLAADAWEDLLRRAMGLAADICRTRGGSLAAVGHARRSQ
ncbi:MAG: sugar kinase [Blastococcus sp.]|nr:sugar kinase [Blastococcus sp.]